MEPTRGPRLPGQGPIPGAPGSGTTPVGPAGIPKRMNAAKTNFSKDNAGGPGPKMGRFIIPFVFLISIF